LLFLAADWLAAENNLLFSAAREPAAENKLFSASFFWRSEAAENKSIAA
jgi:hypothetical protein